MSIFMEATVYIYIYVHIHVCGDVRMTLTSCYPSCLRGKTPRFFQLWRVLDQTHRG